MFHLLDTLFVAPTTALCLNAARRTNFERAGLALGLDSFENASCLFVRADAPGDFGFRLNGSFRWLRCAGGGWLLLSRDSVSASYWLPAEATLRCVSAQGHILDERAAEWTDFDLDSSRVELVFAPPGDGWVFDAVIWKLDNPALIAELQVLTPVETHGYFLLGSHTRYSQPADLYRHLIHGWVYEDRYAWPHKRRICSENDAHALHLVFNGLERATGKRIYHLLKTQLLLSVLSRQGDDGGFRHGEWTDGMEAHYRLHCSAMHLMMDALSESRDARVSAALESAAAFLAAKRDPTEVGIWFVHDELELSEAGMNRGPFKWLPGKALGKSPQNMLVLNTHLDAIIVLDRYRETSGDAQYAPLVESGQKSARAVLALRPAEWLYRMIFSAIGLTLLPSAEAMRLPLWKRLWKRIGWQVFIPRLYRLKNRFPRLAMPSGYIDRHLALGGWAFHYLTVNIMDLARARRRFGGPGFDEVLHRAARFTQESGVRARWKELKYERYALGFWAEALWHLCRVFPDRTEYRTWYAEACADLEAMNMGLPPSHLDGNAEVFPRA